MGFLSDIVEGLVPSTIESIFKEEIPALPTPDIAFKPFTVSGPTGTITGGPEGTSYSLGGTGQQLQSALESAALSRFGATPAGAGQLGAAGQQLLGAGQQQFGQVPAMSPAILGASQNLMGMGQAQLGQTPFGLLRQQQAAQQAFGLGGQFMGQAGMPMGAREQEVYDRIRATQLGEEERQRLALEERLFSQGRGGVRTAMFGGTPEQLALAQAQEEAQNRAALAAISQAQAEQQQQAALGAQFAGLGSGLAGQRQALEAAQQAQALQALTSGTAFAGQEEALRSAQQARALQALQGGMGLMTGGLGLEQAQQQIGLGALQGAYVPQAAMLSAFSPALNVASMADVARRQMGEYELEAAMAKLQAEMGQKTGLASLYGNVYGGLLGGLGTILGAEEPWWKFW